MSVETQGGAAVPTGDEESDEWVADYCSWWVVLGGYSSKKSNVVHLPDAIREDATGDPYDDPPAETLCYSDGRESAEWRTKSHAVLPIDFRDICSKCVTAIVEEIADE